MRPTSVDTTMDVIRPKASGMRRRAPLAVGIALLIAAAIVAMIFLTHTGSGIAVDRSSVVTDTVKHGTLDRSIEASGSLAPQEIHIVAAVQPGTVQAVFVKPGTHVASETPIAQLGNPDLDADVVTARSALEVAQANLVSAQEQDKAAALAQRSSYASAQAQEEMDATALSGQGEMHREGFIADQTYLIARIRAAQSKEQLDVAHAQIGVGAAEENAKVVAARAQVAQAQAELAAKEAEVATLTIRAQAEGIVQSVAIDPGARVDAGTELARVADQRDLKAVLQVPEGQVHSVTIGMPVRVDTGNGVVNGGVARIAPSAQDGSVAVDVSFRGELPPGARPDLNVDGTIQLQTLRNVLSIARPAGAADNSTLSLYRVDPNTSLAHLIQVQLGVGSTDRVEVRSGLTAGDIVIVSDASAYGGASVLRLH